MGCPVCTGSSPLGDVSVVDEKGRRVILQGNIKAIYDDLKRYYCPPFSNYFTATLYPSRKGRVKYLKFETLDELNKWGLITQKRIKCKGCLHKADGKEVVFDVTNVEFL